MKLIKKIFPIAAPILLLAGFSVLHSQTPPGTKFRIVRLDPALDDIISPDAKLETLTNFLSSSRICAASWN